MSNRAEYIDRGQVWSAVGTWAWLVHRITGFSLFLYILQLHVILVSTFLFGDEESFQSMLNLVMFNPVFKTLNAVLLAALYYHILNGMRVLLHDIGIAVSIDSTKRVFRICLFAWVILWLSTISFVL